MKAIVLAILAGVFWGVGEFFAKQVLHTKQIGPITAVTLRTTVALPILWITYLIVVPGMRIEPGDWPRADAGTLAKLIIGPGLCAGTLAMLCFYGALHLGPVSKIKPIAFTIAPAVAVILGWVILGEAMTAKKAAAIVLILGGVALLTGE